MTPMQRLYAEWKEWRELDMTEVDSICRGIYRQRVNVPEGLTLRQKHDTQVSIPLPPRDTRIFKAYTMAETGEIDWRDELFQGATKQTARIVLGSVMFVVRRNESTELPKTTTVSRIGPLRPTHRVSWDRRRHGAPGKPAKGVWHRHAWQHGQVTTKTRAELVGGYDYHAELRRFWFMGYTKFQADLLARKVLSERITSTKYASLDFVAFRATDVDELNPLLVFSLPEYDDADTIAHQGVQQTLRRVQAIIREEYEHFQPYLPGIH